MSEETPAETPVEEPVSEATETPRQEAPPEFVSASDFQTALEAQEERIVSRLKQSTGDKIRDRVSTEIGDALSSFDEVAALLKPHLPEDLDVQGIKRTAFIDSLMSEVPSPEGEPEPDAPPQAETPAPASVPPPFEAEIQTILDTHGLKAEPELVEFAKEHEGEPWWKVGAQFNELAETIAARKAGTSAGVVPPQGQVANPDLEQAFRTELAEATNKGHYGMQTLRNLKAKYAELGLTEEQMDISKADSIHTRGFLYRAESPYSQR